MSSSDTFILEPDQIQGGGGGGPPTGAATGDLGGMYPGPNVTKWQNRPVSAAAPAVNDVMIWSGTQWAPGPQQTPLRMGLTYVTPPAGRDGLIYSLVGNATVDLAFAQALGKTETFIGIYSASRNGIITVRGFPALPIRFMPGLVLVGGMRVFITDIGGYEGMAMPTPPTASGHYMLRLGTIDDATMYNPLDPTGSTALCILNPEPVKVIP